MVRLSHPNKTGLGGAPRPSLRESGVPPFSGYFFVAGNSRSAVPVYSSCQGKVRWAGKGGSPLPLTGSPADQVPL